VSVSLAVKKTVVYVYVIMAELSCITQVIDFAISCVIQLQSVTLLLGSRRSSRL